MLELKEKERDEEVLQKQALGRRNSIEARLEKENASLKAELAQLRDSLRRNGPSTDGNKKATGVTVTERQPLGDLSPNKIARSGAVSIHPDAKAPTASLHLEQDYTKLAAKYKAVLQARDQERAALRKRRDDCNRWASYCDSLESKIKKLERELAAIGQQKSSTLNGEIHTTIQRLPPKPALTDQINSRTVSRGPSPNTSFNADAAIETAHPGLALADLGIPSAPPVSMLGHGADISGQDSTNGGLSEDMDLPPRPPQQTTSSRITIKQEPSSDGPVFVSEKPVRKRKRDDVDILNGAETSRVKSEHNSSDPVLVGELQDFSPHESIDLDEAGHDNSTPKKHRSELENALRHSMNAEDEEFLNMRASKRHQIQLNPVLNKEAVNGLNGLILPESHQTGAVNRQESRGKKHRHRQLDQGIKDLAEDEDDLAKTSEPSAILARPGRLDALLNTPSPDCRPVINRPSRQRQSFPHTTSFEFTTPQPRALPFSRNQESRNLGTPQPARVPQVQGGSFTSAKRTDKMATTPLSNVNGREKLSSSTKQPQLRQLPPGKLALTDFKINPKYNDGHDFAFSEVVRNKAERQTLMGCVDPQCCGKTFRALAMLEREGIGPSITTRGEDIKLLEDYLGANAYRLGSMSREEKEELWLEAKMRELANKHGKHRERYTRRNSPPGFWNTDFPNTQEQQKEREESTKQEQRLVEERYKDAMRGNGRWLFKDE